MLSSGLTLNEDSRCSYHFQNLGFKDEGSRC